LVIFPSNKDISTPPFPTNTAPHSAHRQWLSRAPPNKGGQFCLALQCTLDGQYRSESVQELQQPHSVSFRRLSLLKQIAFTDKQPYSTTLNIPGAIDMDVINVTIVLHEPMLHDEILKGLYSVADILPDFRQRTILVVEIMEGQGDG
jgi:hypothetical protein